MTYSYSYNVTSRWFGDCLNGRKGSRGADAQNRLSRPFYRSPRSAPTAHPAPPGHRGNRGRNTRELANGRRAPSHVFPDRPVAGFRKDFWRPWRPDAATDSVRASDRGRKSTDANRKGVGFEARSDPFFVTDRLDWSGFFFSI